MRVCKWGNSLAVRLPASVVATLGLREGDDIELVSSGRAIEVIKAESRKEILASFDKFEGLMPKDYKFNRHQPI